MTNKIIWPDQTGYKPNVINKRMDFVETNMDGLLPISSKEVSTLSRYAKKNNLKLYELISLRHIIRTQKEIDCHKTLCFHINLIKNKFKGLVENLTKSPNNLKLIKQFFRNIMMPFYVLLKILQPTDEYKKLLPAHIDYIMKIKQRMVSMEHDIGYHAKLFEKQLASYLDKTGIPYRTEDDIRRDKDYRVTPDILFNEPVQIVVNNTTHMVRWMDAKNYTLVNVPFIMRSLREQAAKYNKIFGPGAFVFHYGFDTSVKIPDVLILDSSFIV